ncbi:MAG: hypothetical protein NXH71_02325 [Erythrobacteraceae bacterium]|jgi:hypothetical protein|nr:hypothetical protein [Erythrobacteraceae bacterium]
MTGEPPVTITKVRSLMVATPLYDGAQADYLRSIIGLIGAAQQRGIDCSFAYLSNNASITRVRNILLGTFLRSSATHLLFVDNDIGFVPEQVLTLIDQMQADDRLAVVGAPCPKRRVNWKLVASACEKGLGKANPAELERFSGVFALEPLDPAAGVRVDQPLEVARIGTGLMMIRRNVITELCQRYPELRFRPDPQDMMDGQIEGDLFALFQPLIHPDTGHLMSDDYAFCHRARDAGYRIWAAPWMRTSHTGPARFAGALADLVQLSAAGSTPSSA